MNGSSDSGLERLPAWGVAVSAIVCALSHVLMVAALVTFGQRAGGYLLQALAVGVYATLTLAGGALALWSSTRQRAPAERLLPLFVLAAFLTVAFAGAVFSTEMLAHLGLRAQYMPYLEDDGRFAVLNAVLATWIVALALAVRWRKLLVAGMAAQGLALLLNPGLVAGSPRYGLATDALPLLTLPLLYLGAAVALGWRPRLSHLWWLLALCAGGLALAALLSLGVFPDLRAQVTREPETAASLVPLLLAAGAFYVFVLGLPALAWRLWAWGSDGQVPAPLAATGVGLALLVWVAWLSWTAYGPGHGLPAEGQTLGWIDRTVPDGAYGLAGHLLGASAVAYPWLLGAASLAWLVAVAQAGRRLGLQGIASRLGLPGGLVLLGFGMLLQGTPLPIQGLAGALPQALGEEGLRPLACLAYPLLGLGLLAAAAALPGSSSRWRSWLTFLATLLALAAALILSAELVAGTILGLESLRDLRTLTVRQAAQSGLALSVPLNAALAIAGWAVCGSGLRALRAPEGPAALSRVALRRAFALAGVVTVLVALAFWQVTALPVLEISPRDGEMDVATNAPVVVRLRARNWGPGISATYAETGEYVSGGGGGSATGELWFSPDGAWRPNARVNVRLCCGPFRRKYDFSFTTGAGPSPDVTLPPGPGPRPTALPASANVGDG